MQMRMSKEQYDQLYYYVDGSVYQRLVVNRGDDPLRHTSPRRYETVDEVRKAALAKSIKVNRESKYVYTGKSTDQVVMKGRRFIGVVSIDIGGRFDGLWWPAEHPKDPSPLRKDGSIGARR